VDHTICISVDTLRSTRDQRDPSAPTPTEVAYYPREQSLNQKNNHERAYLASGAGIIRRRRCIRAQGC